MRGAGRPSVRARPRCRSSAAPTAALPRRGRRRRVPARRARSTATNGERLEDASRGSSSGSTASSRCATRRSSSARSSASTRRCSCSRASADRTTTALEHVLDLLSDVPAGKLAIAELPRPTPGRGRRARARRRRRGDRRRRRRRAGSPVRRLPRSEPESRWGALARRSSRSSWPACALRLVGIALRAARSAAQPGRGEHRPARVGDGARRRRSTRPCYDYPSLLMDVLAPFAGSRRTRRRTSPRALVAVAARPRRRRGRRVARSARLRRLAGGVAAARPRSRRRTSRTRAWP